MKVGKIIAHIPARGGSKRVPAKNLRLLNGRPMIGYAIEAAQNCSKLKEVYVNTDSDLIAKFACGMNCLVYRRPTALGSDTATGDDFTYDFICAKKADTLVMISPVCPLIDSSDIENALAVYESNDIDTLISCSETKMQVFEEDRPININLVGPLSPTQNNKSVNVCNWAIAVWNTAKFKELYLKYKGGYFGEKRLLWPIDPIKAVKISEEKDFKLAEAILVGRKMMPKGAAPEYWFEN